MLVSICRAGLEWFGLGGHWEVLCAVAGWRRGYENVGGWLWWGADCVCAVAPDRSRVIV
ncbi:hypothetical protein HMPREF3198_00719 [Winkia neuii]|nr:hypothetical protein HMPREF3198_00719 [Winkia neuii]